MKWGEWFVFLAQNKHWKFPQISSIGFSEIVPYG